MTVVFTFKNFIVKNVLPVFFSARQLRVPLEIWSATTIYYRKLLLFMLCLPFKIWSVTMYSHIYNQHCCVYLSKLG